LLFIGNSEAGHEALSPLIEEIVSRDNRLRVLVSSGDPAILHWLGQRFPALLTVPLPYANRISAELYLRQLKIRAVAFVEAGGLNLSQSLVAKLQQLAIGIVTISGRNAESLFGKAGLSNVSEACVVVGDAVDQSSLPQGISTLAASGLADRFEVMLARDLKALRKPGVIANLLVPQRWRWAVTWRVACLADLDRLKQRLGSPATIMCLGNGPSSADPALLHEHHDVLFRVNHSWLDKKFMVKPDVVFTGGRPSMRALDDVIFGVQNTEAEDRLMQTRAFNPLRSPTTCFNANDRPMLYDRSGWKTGITNYRYGIPAMCGGKGRAIYNDVDQLYLADPGEMFDLEMGNAGMLCITPRETSAMLIDCEKMISHWTLAYAQRGKKHKFFRETVQEKNLWGRLPAEWNARDDEFTADKSKCFHFTTLQTQPWQPFPDVLRYEPHPDGEVWFSREHAADAAGFSVFTKKQPSRRFADVLQQQMAIHASANAADKFVEADINQLVAESGAKDILSFGLDEDAAGMTTPSGLMVVHQKITSSGQYRNNAFELD
jgi:hypothetical protein